MRESDEEAALLGRIAVRHGFISMEQLAECTVERGRAGKKLGAIMLEKGLLSELELAKVLALQKRHRENLAKKLKQREPTARRRIHTPKDWVATAPVDASPRKIPRRQRRTADVARDLMRKGLPARGERSEPFASSPAVERPPRSERPTPPERPRASLPRSERPTPRTPVDGPRSERPTPPSDAPRPEIDDNARVRSERPTDPPKATVVERAKIPAQPRLPSESRTDPKRKDAKRKDPRRPHRPTPVEVPAARDDDDALEVSLDDPSPQSVQDHLLERRRPLTSQPPDDDERPRRNTPLAVTREDVELEPQPWDPPPATPEVSFLHKMLEHAAQSKASDVHVHAGMVAMMRQFGGLTAITDEALSADACESLLTNLLTRWQRGRLERDGEIDIAYAIDGIGRFRANIYHHHRGLNGVFHVIPSSPPSLASLGLPEALAKLTNYAQGLILLTGPGGSGKTSTLASLVDIINTERSDHILTIEDPVEYVHESRRCIVNQRQVGRHTASFASGLRGALREDPDIICIGELRDLETISLALSAAETGHLVLATLHTGSAIGTINRVVGAYPPSQQSQVRAMMSESLRAVTSQRLLPAADGHGVVPALEVLYVNKAVGALIRDNRTFQIHSIMQTGKAHGMRLLDASIKNLFDNHEITREVAELNVNDKRVLG